MRELLLGLMILSLGCEEKEKTDAEWKAEFQSQQAMREAYAKTVQDDMRNQGAGRVTVKATGYLGVTLTLNSSDCTLSLLRTLTASPKVQKALKEMGFTEVECEGGEKVYYPYED